MDHQMTPEGFANCDNEKYTSLPEINSDDVDWKDASIETYISMLLKGK